MIGTMENVIKCYGETTALYAAALERLSAGTEKNREAVHNLNTVSFIKVFKQVIL